MRIADSHEFLELYRGDKDLRMGIEMVKLRDDLHFASFAPDRLSPNDGGLFGARTLREVGLPIVPDRMEIRLLPSVALRFARKESGGIVSFMPTYTRELRRWKPDVIIENPFSWLTPRNYQTHLVAQSVPAPLVYYDPGDDIPVGKKHRTMALWESSVLKDVAAVITFNEAGARRFVDKYSYPPERITVIPKPVDVGRFKMAAPRRQAMRRRLGLSDEHFAVGYLGRLAKYKGSALLLETAESALQDSSLSRLRFVFVGGSLGSAGIDENIVLSNTVVTGMVPNAEVPDYLAALDVVVFPDVTRPGGFPTATAEAMAAGKTLIVGVGSTTRFMPLTHGRNALLVPPSCPAAILESLRLLLSEPQLATRLGATVGRDAETTMDYPVVAARWLDIIEGVQGQSPVSR